jgi:hypothetical protein
MEKHLYCILYPINALVGSQLDPATFARHFNAGSSKYYSGKLIFADVDINFRNPFFPIERVLEQVVPHEDGRPKATKYVATYRVLENIDFEALGLLHISTPEGYILSLNSAPYQAQHQPGLVRVFAEISPINMLVLSDYNFIEFASYITNPENPVGAPKMFYTQIDLDIDEFLKELQNNPLAPSPIPEVHPSLLRDGILEIQRVKTKHTKGLSMVNPLWKISYRRIRHGFMFASQEKVRFYPMPSHDEIESTNYRFWKNM